MKAVLPPNESQRLEALREYDILDTDPERAFDDLTHLAAQICETPISAITLVDADRQWFKSRIGLETSETPREVSFCAHTILGDDLLLVPDATADERFAENPFVKSDPHLRFYAGVPLISPEGQAVGSLCVVDTVARQLNQTQQDALRILGRQAIMLLEAKPITHAGQSRQARQRAERELRALNEENTRRDTAHLQSSEMRYRRLFEAAQDGILILDATSGRIEDVNPYLCHLLGYALDEFIGKQLWEIGVFRDIAANQEAFRILQDEEYIRYDDLPLETKEGKSIYVEFVSNVYTASGQKVIQCNIRDIGERKQAEADLRQAHGELETRVEGRTQELIKANEALQTAKEAADVANTAKSEFLSRMSHELRTPLNAILGFGQILEMQELSPRTKESIGYILKGGKHLLGLINEVLDIARVEAGHIELSFQPISLTEMVPEVCALVRPLAATHNIHLYENSAELAHRYILADHQRLQQVLLNLLANGIKYNRDGGLVEVSCEQKPEGSISIAVRDTGPGISPQDLQRLFVPFERLNAANSGIEGTGLGLVLSQRLMIAMGGILRVESTLGEGTIFTAELPQATTPNAAIVINTPARVSLSRANGERTYSILCIEDNLSNIQLIEAIFEMRPEWSLQAVMQGSIGLDLARQHYPDLILLDLNLPDMEGMEVLTRLRRSALTRDIPVVIVSADATPIQIERLLAAGAQAYLTKPLDIDLFLHTLDNIFQMSPDLNESPLNEPEVSE